jgi:hypothetical protein
MNTIVSALLGHFKNTKSTYNTLYYNWQYSRVFNMKVKKEKTKQYENSRYSIGGLIVAAVAGMIAIINLIFTPVEGPALIWSGVAVAMLLRSDRPPLHFLQGVATFVGGAFSGTTTLNVLVGASDFNIVFMFVITVIALWLGFAGSKRGSEGNANSEHDQSEIYQSALQDNKARSNADETSFKSH